MESTALSTGVEGVAASFNCCIECFEAFSSTQAPLNDSDMLLVELDLQQERLLTWGDLVGITKTQDQGRNSILDKKENLVQEGLASLHQLLSDESKFQTEYGLRPEPADGSATTQHYLSSGRAGIFKKSYKKVLRAAGRPGKFPTTSPNRRWVIQNKTKFKTFISHVGDMVDSLHDIAPVQTRQQDALVFQDFAELKGPEMKAVQAACEDRYKSWSDATSAIIAASEAGSIDHRTVADWVQETNAGEDEPGLPPLTTELRTTLTQAFKRFRLSLSSGTFLYFILTGVCFLQGTDGRCNSTNLGAMTLRTLGESFFPGRGTVVNKKWLPTERITQCIKEGNDGTMYVYCGLCTCALRTALSICETEERVRVECFVRPDDRIETSCQSAGTPLNRLICLLDMLKSIEAMPIDEAREFDNANLALIDRVWLEQRIYQLEEEFYDEVTNKDRIDAGAELFEELKDSNSSRTVIVILGELEACQWMMQTPPFPRTARMPKETEIHQLSGAPNWKRDFLGTFTPRHYHLSKLESRKELTTSMKRFTLPSEISLPHQTLPPRSAYSASQSQEDLYEASIDAGRNSDAHLGLAGRNRPIELRQTGG
jgi:Prion-inhibition and propagation